MPTPPPRYVIATWRLDDSVEEDLESFHAMASAVPHHLMSITGGIAPDCKADNADLVHVKVVRGRPAPDHSRQTVLYSREDVPSHYAPELRPTNTGEPVGVQGERERGTVYP